MKVTLTDYVWQRMKAYVDLCSDEISGLGKVERDEQGGFRIVDIALFEQTVSAAHSDITSESLAKFQVELIKKGESLEDWNFWWHSHAKMDVFFSGTDTGTIDGSTEFPYLVSLVTNHKHEFTARVDIFSPVRLYKMLDVEIEEDENEEIIKECQEHIDAKVSRPTPRVSPYRGSLFDNDYPRMGFSSQRLPVVHTIDDDTPGIESADELEQVLQEQGMGTDSFAVAIEAWERLMTEVEIELGYYEQSNDRKQAKKARKELRKLERLGKDYGLDITYDS